VSARSCFATARAALMILLAAGVSVEAAELKVLSGNGARAAVSELAARFERASGHKVAIHFEVNPAVKRGSRPARLRRRGLNPPVLDDLVKQGRIAADTRGVIGRSGIGVAVRAGTLKPDISSVLAFKRTLLDAKSVAYPGEGASGKYFVGLVDRLGIAAEMKPKMRPMPAEYNVEAVARGEAELVVVASRISGVPASSWSGRSAGAADLDRIHGRRRERRREPAAARELVRSSPRRRSACPQGDGHRAVRRVILGLRVTTPRNDHT
jgi:molybdate transport system substrate-binding protein